jgi:hypothetical protein
LGKFEVLSPKKAYLFTLVDLQLFLRCGSITMRHTLRVECGKEIYPVVYLVFGFW